MRRLSRKAVSCKTSLFPPSTRRTKFRQVGRRTFLIAPTSKRATNCFSLETSTSREERIHLLPIHARIYTRTIKYSFASVASCGVCEPTEGGASHARGVKRRPIKGRRRIHLMMPVTRRTFPISQRAVLFPPSFLPSRPLLRHVYLTERRER